MLDTSPATASPRILGPGILRRDVGPRVAQSRRPWSSDDHRSGLRLQLDADDVGKVSVRSGGGPFTETLFSLHLLRERHPYARGSGWWTAVRASFEPSSNPLAVLDALELPVDLHAVAWQAPSMHEALRRLANASSEGATSDGVAPHLVRLVLDYYVRAVDPYWRRIRSHLAAEQARCARAMAEGGVAQLLTSLHPSIRWRSPLLEVTNQQGRRYARAPGPAPEDGQGTHVLGGRALVLVPSVFCMDGPLVLFSEHDQALPIVLVYPALRQTEDASSVWAQPAAPDPSALGKLLGRTQAAALAAIADTCTTTELADRVGVSPPTASHHVSILRGAGLILSRRTGSSVVHRLTALGAELLGADALDG